MKKTGAYLLLLASGIALGYFLFGNPSESIAPVDGDKIRPMGRWTCSMHPQIDGEEGGTCPLCAMDLVHLEDIETMLGDDQFQMSEGAMALANIETFKVGGVKETDILLKLSGVITTNAETDAVQTTLFEGRLDELYPNYVGKKVWRGQEIGKVYSPELYLAQDKLLTSVSYRETHPKLYNAARYTLGLWKMTDEQINEMLKKGKPMMNFPLYSDVTGTVTEVLGKEGNYYDEGTAIFKVSNLNTVWAVFDVYEEQLPLLSVGQHVEVSLTALPNESISGKIDFIEPILDSKKRTAAVRTILYNKSGKLKPGMFAEATIKSVVSDEKSFLTIPESAVLWTGKRSVVYVKPYADQPIFQLTEVDLGQSLKDGYVVLSGLKKGDEIVVEGAFTVDAAAQLTGKNSMMNRKLNNEYIEMPHHEIKDDNGPKPLNISEVNRFVTFLLHYFELKDALVGTNFALAHDKARELSTELNEILNMNEFHNTPWSDLNQELNKIKSAGDIEEVRKYFKPFSNNLIGLVKNLEGYKKTIYVQFCPMADNNKGGSWLSLQEEIRNPYYGEKMLICGVVKEQIN